MARARLSLDGLSMGDALGERLFYKSDVEGLIARRALPRAPWRYTDDTVMALSIVEILAAIRPNRARCAGHRFAERYQADPGRGYGPTAMEILEEIGQRHATGRIASPRAFNGTGSMGNGGAMRAGPVGAYFADDFSAVVEEARRFRRSRPMRHPEGPSRRHCCGDCRSKGLSTEGFESGMSQARTILEAAIQYTPEGMTRQGLKTALMTASCRGG